MKLITKLASAVTIIVASQSAFSQSNTNEQVIEDPSYIFYCMDMSDSILRINDKIARKDKLISEKSESFTQANTQLERLKPMKDKDEKAKTMYNHWEMVKSKSTNYIVTSIRDRANIHERLSVVKQEFKANCKGKPYDYNVLSKLCTDYGVDFGVCTPVIGKFKVDVVE